MKKFTLVILGVALVGGLLAFFVRPSQQGKDVAPASPEKKAPKVLGEVLSFDDIPEHPGTPFLAAGDLRHYRYRSVTAVRLSLEKGGTEMVLRAGGELSVRTYDVSDPIVQGYQFQPILLEAGNELVGNLGDFRPLQSQLETEFFVKRDTNGKVLSIHFEEGIDKEARNILRGLLAPFEIVRGDSQEDRWEIRGDDTTGRFLAEYVIEERSEETLVVTRRKSYEDLYFSGIPNSLETGESPLQVETGGQTRIHLDAASQLTRITGNEHVKMVGKNDRMSLDVSSRMEVFAVLVGIQRNEPGVLARAQDLAGDLPGQSFVDFAPETTMETLSTVELADLDDLVAGLVKAVAAGEWYKKAPQAYLSLKELMESSLEARLRVQELLASGEYPQEVLQTLADSLGATSSGWKEILSLLEREGVDPLRQLILTRSLGLVPRPGKEVIGVLSGLAANEEDAFSAMMAIRSLGLSAGLPTNYDQREFLVDGLLPLLGGPEERDIQVLNALGNAGVSGALPEILKFADSPKEEIRAAVAVAVRKIDSPKVDDLLEKLAGDSSVEVRLSAVGILSEKGGKKVPALLKKVYESDPNEGVRLEALEYFTGCTMGDVTAVQVLTGASNNDPSAGVRSYALNALKKMATK